MKYALLIFLFLTQSVHASRGGTEVGNGGDNFPAYHDTAWFLGENRVIRACLSRSSSFPLSSSEIRAAIQGAFGKWIEYIKAKGVYDLGYLYEAEEGDPTTSTLNFAEKLQVRSRCRGDEDLVFHLGTVDDSIKKARRKFADPVSFALHENFDLKNGWSRGFIWFNNEGIDGRDWRTPALFETILLHELGHVFGVGHVPDTVMAENIVSETAQRLKGNGLYGYRKETLNTIDTIRQLYACLNCDEKFYDYSNSKTQSELSGRMIRGPITCDLHFNNRFDWDFELVCQDALGSLWSIVNNFEHSPVSAAIPIFKRSKLRGEEVITESVEALNGQIIYGKLVTVGGEVYNVVLERNINDNSSGLNINLLHKGKVLPLFQAMDQHLAPELSNCARALEGPG